MVMIGIALDFCCGQSLPGPCPGNPRSQAAMRACVMDFWAHPTRPRDVCLGANGILDVTARDTTTNRRHDCVGPGRSPIPSVRVTGATRLADAAQLNNAGAVCHQAEKTSADVGDRLTNDWRSRSNAALGRGCQAPCASLQGACPACALERAAARYARSQGGRTRRRAGAVRCPGAASVECTAAQQREPRSGARLTGGLGHREERV